MRALESRSSLEEQADSHSFNAFAGVTSSLPSMPAMRSSLNYNQNQDKDTSGVADSQSLSFPDEKLVSRVVRSRSGIADSINLGPPSHHEHHEHHKSAACSSHSLPVFPFLPVSSANPSFVRRLAPASSVSSTGGVGDLPGPSSEFGVGILPEEKVEIKRQGLGDLPEGMEGVGRVEKSELYMTK